MKILFAACAAWMLVACNSTYEKEKTVANEKIVSGEKVLSVAEDSRPPADAGYSDSVALPQRTPQQKGLPAPAPLTKTDWDKKIIKTGTLNAEVKNYDSFYLFVRDQIKSLGGYIAEEQQEQSDYKIENTVMIKVPVGEFDRAIDELAAGAARVNERKVSSQDVTGELIDVKSRMEAKREIRQRYIELLKQAHTMQDILGVQSEINEVQEQIESAAGRIDYLSHAAALSTIHLTFFQVLNVSAGNYSEPSFLAKISESFREGWRWSGNLVIGLVSIWPLLLIAVTLWVILKKFIRRVKPVNPSLNKFQ